MSEPDFLQKAFAGKSPQIRELAVKILNLYLTSPLSSRDDTSEDRKARVRNLVEQAVRSGKRGNGR